MDPRDNRHNRRTTSQPIGGHRLTSAEQCVRFTDVALLNGWEVDTLIDAVAYINGEVDTPFGATPQHGAAA